MTPTRRPVRLLPLALAAALLAGSAHAQSLLELYESARGYDAAWQSAKAQYDANVYGAEQARAGLLPSAGLSAGASRSQFTNVTPDIKRGITSQNATLSAVQPLYRPANLAAYRQGERQAEVAQSQLTAATQDLIVRVSQAYFDVLAAQDTLTFVRAQKAATSEQLASAKRNFEVGTATITDTREAQARFDLVVAQEIAAENDLRVKKLALDSVTGRSNAQPVPVATTALPGPQPADVEAWVTQSETASPSVQQARLGLEIAQLETEKARAGHKPTLDLVASWSANRYPDGSTTIGGSTRNDTSTIGLQFNLPLFAGFATQNRVRQTLSLEEKAQADLDNARRTVAQATRSAYLGLVSGQGQVKALEAAEASSQSALEANQLGYQVGVRINIDVLNAQSQLYQTKRDLAQARYNVLLGQLRLKQANGTLAPDDLAQLSQRISPAAKP
ncbi:MULTISPECIES: TolC family outer membrane protein [Ramlibacter]|uniref:TolC family outer membrane protein n=1 Tax=Ramlibacter aquaticus TaxID=2780094 RepID=A0ABR9SHA2_9BURK|nr:MULTISPECIES: TolC family outer membrane protein [Ramlibacter]MBE7941738.1 TolC family outer membrane protein [Ramlibacter aquaticus]